MPKTVLAEVRIADLPKMQQFIGSVAALLKALGKSDGLPRPVMDAADQVRQAVADLGGRDVGPPPDSDEKRIRTAMNIAQENPGRTVTVE